jgi:hypothetical protein
MRSFLNNYRHAFGACDALHVARDGAVAIAGGIFCVTWAALSPLTALYGALRPTRFFMLLHWISE